MTLHSILVTFLLIWNCLVCAEEALSAMCRMRNTPQTGNGLRTAQSVYVARRSNNRVISSGDLYCCFLPQCESLCSRSGPRMDTFEKIYIYGNMQPGVINHWGIWDFDRIFTTPKYFHVVLCLLLALLPFVGQFFIQVHFHMKYYLLKLPKPFKYKWRNITFCDLVRLIKY